MHIEAIKFKKEKDSQWESGYYVGQYENSDNSVILDSNYKPVIGEIWDCHENLDNNIKIFIPEKDE